ncbi:MAG: hypothetical protein HYV97_15580 [Bdellovibrio sp.]|nr:hypothetical protein [Bdellovibrio sp.]
MALVDHFNPNALLRSWYRYGEPSASKNYSKRKAFIEAIKKRKIHLGGGISLSIVNERDLVDPQFRKEWLSVELDGVPIKNGRLYGSISSPHFRKYLINKIIDQAALGVTEFHLGESNGALFYDDWTLGIKGENGFIQWLKNKYLKMDQSWWGREFGKLGEKIFHQIPITRLDFLSFNEKEKENFEREWGVSNSWSGNNKLGEPAFLFSIYRNNLENFLSELREQLMKRNFKESFIDVWGFADWMINLNNKPDAFLTSPPDERWGLNWEKKPEFSLQEHKVRIFEIMKNEIIKASPIPLVYMFDHPKPFFELAKLTDERQSEITAFFYSISKELNVNFVIRSYSEENTKLGPKMAATLKEICHNSKNFEY